MKRLLFVFFILFNLSSFAWNTIRIVDEFGDPTGESAIRQYDSGENYITIYEDDRISLHTEKFIGRKKVYLPKLNLEVTDNTEVKLKIDNNSPFILYGGIPHYDESFVNIFLSSQQKYLLMQEMKKGKILKVSIEKYNGGIISLRFDLKGFSKYLKILNDNSKY